MESPVSNFKKLNNRTCFVTKFLGLFLISLPSPSLSERRKYCVAQHLSPCHAVCVCCIGLVGEVNVPYPMFSSLLCNDCSFSGHSGE